MRERSSIFSPVMRYCFLVILFALLSCSTVWSQNLSIGQWYAHLPHEGGRKVIDTGDEIFVLTDVYYFSYNKTTGNIQRFDKVSGLNDVQVDHLVYGEQVDALIIAYQNTNIDIIKNGNTIINVSDILRKSISGVKEINAVLIEDSIAYFATTFGIAVFDIEKEEFRDTYIIGDDGRQVSVIDVSFEADSMYALTSEGLKKAPSTGANLANYQNWENIGNASGLPVSNGRALEMVGDTTYILFSDSVYRGVNGNWQFYYADTTHVINTIKATNNILYILESDSVPLGRLTYNNNGNWEYIGDGQLNIPSDVTQDSNGILWVADGYKSLVKIEPGGALTSIVPNGPNSFAITGMSYKNGALWVAPGGAGSNWNYILNYKGFSSLQNNFWSQYNRFNVPLLEEVLNIFAVTTSPVTDKIYFGSYWDGVLIWDGATIVKFNKDNTNGVLKGTIGDEQRTRISSLTLDDAGNLWVSNYGSPTPLSAYTTDGTWVGMRTPSINSGVISKVVIDDFNQKWAVIPNQGLLVYNHGADIANTSDDEGRILTSATGNGALPNNDVVSVAKDKQGQIWVGTSQGLAIFYCAGSVLSQGCDAQRIIVSRDGFNGYLLENERINYILVDGADRKWVATNNGLWVFSPDGTEELAYYTQENSPLLSDNVISLGYDGEHGVMYISTDRGLMSLRTEATEGTITYIDPIEVFPNPIRETYSGPIAIRGLPSDAEVRITDVTGMLIYQTQAFGGQAVWDGKDYTGRKAKTGVYLVFSVNEDGTESKPTKLLFIK